ncbi:TLDc domain-containing protein [Entamoeba marina]
MNNAISDPKNFMIGLNYNLNDIKERFKEVEKNISTVFSKDEIKEGNEIIEDKNEGTHEEVMKKYKEMYSLLENKIGNNDSIINEVCDFIDCIDNSTNHIKEISSQQEFKSNNLKDIANKIVDDMIACEEKEMKNDIENRTQQFNQIKQELNKLKLTHSTRTTTYSIQQTIEPNNSFIEQIEPSLIFLKEWSGFNHYSIIYDTDIDDGNSNECLIEKVKGKKNLYFISSDTSNNIYGGFVGEIINGNDIWIQDKNSFVFSLTRNGLIVNKKYSILNNYDDHYAFKLFSYQNVLYCFGGGSDICIGYLNSSSSFCYPYFYSYDELERPLVDVRYPDTFYIQRIIVVQMD